MSGTSRDVSQLVYCLHPQIAVETFEEGGLVLHLIDQKLFEINLTALFLLNQLDGKRTVAQIAERIAQEFEITPAQALADASELHQMLADLHIVTIAKFYQVGGNMAEPRYIRNPDVGLREQDENGGLLFNPDTHQMQLVNSTGLEIWQLCDGTRDLQGIIDAMMEIFEGAPAEEIAADVRMFVEGMKERAFIGTVEQVELGGTSSNG